MSHKALLPLATNDIVGSVLLSIGLMVASSAGIGGGGIVIPILISVLSFSPEFAVPLSNIAILGGAVTNLAINIYKTHPMDESRPLIDWEIAAMMEPLTMLGAVGGAFLNVLLPQWMIVVFMIIVMLLLSARTTKLGLQQWSKENSARAEHDDERHTDGRARLPSNVGDIHLSSPNSQNLRAAEARAKSTKGIIDMVTTIATPTVSAEQTGLLASTDVSAPPQASASYGCTDEGDAILFQQLVLADDKIRNFKKRAVMWLLLLFLGIVVLNGVVAPWFRSRYSIVLALVVIWIVVVFAFVRCEVIHIWHLKKLFNFTFLAGDVEWNRKNSILFPIVCVVAGVVAGLLGIGGGVVKGPLMLELGADPLVASATCSTMILFTSLTALTSYLVFARVAADYSIFLFSLGVVSTMAGQTLGAMLIKRYNRKSLVTLSIAFLIAVSAVLMTSEATSRQLSGVNQEQDHTRTVGAAGKVGGTEALSDTTPGLLWLHLFFP